MISWGEKLYKVKTKEGTHISEKVNDDGSRAALQFDEENGLQGPVDLIEVDMWKHMSEMLERQFLNPNKELESFRDRISEIINYEWDQRESTKFNKLLKKATLKYAYADFDESMYEADRMPDTHTIELLRNCSWIDEPKNLLITGSAGAGKTYLIVSQLPVSKWWNPFKDNTYADACLSRMTSKAYRLECNGRDMRKS